MFIEYTWKSFFKFRVMRVWVEGGGEGALFGGTLIFGAGCCFAVNVSRSNLNPQYKRWRNTMRPCKQTKATTTVVELLKHVFPSLCKATSTAVQPPILQFEEGVSSVVDEDETFEL